MSTSVQDIMSSDVKVVAPNDNLTLAARLMAREDIGSLFVAKDDQLVGVITDRDITVRAVAENRTPSKCKVSDIMSPEIKYVYADETVDDVARNMSALRVRRLPVLNRDKRLVGVVSLGDLAYRHGGNPAEQAIHDVSRPNHREPSG